MTLYVFGDSFAHEHNYPFCYYHKVAEGLDTNLKNFGEKGTGCTNMIRKFMSNQYDENNFFIILLSAPERLDYDFIPEGWTAPAYKEFSGENNSKIIEIVDEVLKDEFELSNIKNVLFFKHISDYFETTSKFFVCTTFGYDNQTYSQHLKQLSNDKFYASDLNLDVISTREFIDYDIMDCDTNYNRFRYDDGSTKLIFDNRPNHLSEKNHEIFSQIILDFFDNGPNDYKQDLFKISHLDENSDFMKLKKEYIYE
tara:strand:- start:4831 stop:5592 length:762 start_codon:yes stop_codon:yes gene_type:complete